MPRSIGRLSAGRAGFTLIELIVVISFVILLATLAVVFLPGFQESQKAGQGCSQLQHWLLIAKQRAMRDQVNTGLRLNLLTTELNEAVPNRFITTLEYIQQPEDYAPTGSGIRFQQAGGLINVDIFDPKNPTNTSKFNWVGE